MNSCNQGSRDIVTTAIGLISMKNNGKMLFKKLKG